MIPADGTASPPDIEFDYRGLFSDLLAAVSAGHHDRAVEVLTRAAGGSAMTGGWEELRKQFAVVYGGGGVYQGDELLGYKQLSGRLLKVYTLGYWERVVVLFTVTLNRTPGGWRLVALSLSDKIEELDALAPFRPARDPAPVVVG